MSRSSGHCNNGATTAASSSSINNHVGCFLPIRKEYRNYSTNNTTKSTKMNYNNTNKTNRILNQSYLTNITAPGEGATAASGAAGTKQKMTSPPPAVSTTTQTTATGLINGIKNIFNGFLTPKLNCDFYSDHHRYYNPKYRNNYMWGKQLELMKRTTPDHNLKTILLDMNATTLNENYKTMMDNKSMSSTSCCSSTTKQHQSKSDNKNIPSSSSTNCHSNNNMESEIVAIFTSEDFPELPVPKKPSSTTIWQPIPNEKCSYFEISFNNCNRNNNNNSKKSKKLPSKQQQQQHQHQQQQRRESECDSEDSFIVFLNDSPKCTAGITPYRTKPSHQRQRQLSECSDDSFVICFTDDAAEGVIEFSDITTDISDTDTDTDDDDDDTDEDEDSDEDGDDDDDHDRVNNGINKTDNIDVPSQGTSQPDSGFDDQKDRKVRFNLLPEVHMMHTWNFAYRAARKGHWENYARDRLRFKHRVEKLSDILEPILNRDHRETVYRTRFCDSKICEN